MIGVTYEYNGYSVFFKSVYLGRYDTEEDCAKCREVLAGLGLHKSKVREIYLELVESGVLPKPRPSKPDRRSRPTYTRSISDLSKSEVPMGVRFSKGVWAVRFGRSYITSFKEFEKAKTLRLWLEANHLHSPPDVLKQAVKVYRNEMDATGL